MSGGEGVVGAVERQTVDLVEHPEHGRCYAVHNNGPSFIQLESGERLDARVTLGGADKSGSYRLVDRVRCNVIEQGTRHERAFNTMLGEGWLVWPPPAGKAWEVRFEPDEGSPVAMSIVSMSVGRPAYAAKMARSRSRMPKAEDPDEMRWATYETTEGEVIAFRRGGKPPESGERSEPQSRQGVLRW